MKKQIDCPVCNGRGYVTWNNCTETTGSSTIEVCPHCDGTGKRMVTEEHFANVGKMFRLIDANALRRDAFHIKQRGKGIRCVVDWDDIENAPTVDAVEVVRCKDCKYAKNMAPIGESEYEIGECILRKEDEIEFMVYDDDFCSYGERKDNDI